MEMIEDKDAEVKSWERKYNELYISNFYLIQTNPK